MNDKVKTTPDEVAAKEQHLLRSVTETITALENKNFKWISFLGRGGYGVVAEMENRSNQQVLAAKIMLDEKVKDSERIL